MGEEKIIGGRFTVAEEIGEGGMGTVYRGIDTLSGDPVAIKSLKKDVNRVSTDIVERFAREGEALRKLNHPNIVKVLGTVEEDDQHYIIMEYVGGGSLRELLDEQGGLPVHQVLEIALDLSDALTRAHRLNIIHRDIKPANVMIAEDGTPRLTDFGVARIGGTTQMTETGAVLGTLAYLSPEAISGERIDERSDIWAFGILLYEMLSNRLPFSGENTGMLLNNILRESPTDIKQFRDDLPNALVGLIYWMLEKDRHNRISSVRLVGAQLEAMMSDSGSLLNDFIHPQTGRFTDQTPTPSNLEIILQTGRLPIQNDSLNRAPTTIDTDEISRSDWSLQVKRVIDHAPRIFISYRRADSIAVTGRLYDRLLTAFGDKSVFKDVDDIPPGSDFKQVLESEVAQADVLLAIIGQDWNPLDAATGQNRLMDKNDFVRIEIAAGLARPDMLVIPILVNNAQLPRADVLPANLRELIHRNAATVRNDPDFNRDTQWLIHQIQNSFVRQKNRRNPILASLAAVLIIGMILLGIVASSVLNPQIEITPESASSQIVAPVDEGQYMVLVAQIETIGAKGEDVTRFIVDDLQRRLVDDAPYSIIAIRQYRGVITSSEEAQAIANENNAPVIIWGNNDGNFTELNIEIGTYAKQFPFATNFSEQHIRNMLNIRIRLDNVRTQSIASEIGQAYVTLFGIEGDAWNMSTVQVIRQNIDIATVSGEIVNTGIAASYQKAGRLFFSDPGGSLAELENALKLDGGNPILYLIRAQLKQRLLDFDSAEQDLATAIDLGPDNWYTPALIKFAEPALFQSPDNDDIAIIMQSMTSLQAEFETFAQLRPDDWYNYFILSVVYLVNSDFEEAKQAIEQSIALKPPTSIPYIFGVLIGIQRGDFATVGDYIQIIRRDFPDPEVGFRLVNALYFGGEKHPLMTSIAGFTYLILRQYDKAIEELETAVNSIDDVSFEGFESMRLILGLAYCVNHQLPEAEAEYTKVIENSSEYAPFAYALRSDARRQQGNLIGAGTDILEFSKSEFAAQFMGLVTSIDVQEFDCGDFLEMDFRSMVATATASALNAPIASPIPSATNTAEAIVLEPLEENQYMILVAQFEHIGGEERDIQRIIVDDLVDRFETFPLSPYAVRAYPRLISNKEDAIAAADEVGAWLVIWGNYDDALVDVTLQVGSLDLMKFNVFSREDIDKLTYVRVQLQNPRRETLVMPILAVFQATFTFNNETVFVAFNTAIGNLLEVDSPQVVGNSLAARWNLGVQAYMRKDYAESLAIFDEMLRLDSSNPLVWIARSLVRHSMGQYADSLQDVNTAMQFSPPNWIAPLGMKGNSEWVFNADYDAAADYYHQAIEKMPKISDLHLLYGLMKYLTGDYVESTQAIEQALALGTRYNTAYYIQAALFLRAGEFAQAQAIMKEVLQKFPDPSVSELIIESIYNDALKNTDFAIIARIFGYLTLKQWSEIINSVNSLSDVNVLLSDLYFMEGFAYCNLREYDKADAAYSRAIEIDPTYPLLYALRAEVRRKNSDLLGAGADVAKVLELDTSDTYSKLMPLATAGTINCENFFDVDLSEFTIGQD